MTPKEMLDYCLAKPHAVMTLPFGVTPICVTLGGKIFAQIFPDRQMVTLKCARAEGEFYRRQYPDAIRPGYHCPAVQRPYFNSVDLTKIEDDALLLMADHAYESVLNKLSKKDRQLLTE